MVNNTNISSNVTSNYIAAGFASAAYDYNKIYLYQANYTLNLSANNGSGVINWYSASNMTLASLTINVQFPNSNGESSSGVLGYGVGSGV
jgi:hypothetical protein